MTPEELSEYIQRHMRLSHIYQPVMLEVLLRSGGEASLEDIAKALLSYDQSQVDYYALRTKNMVGKVLTQNGVVEPVKDGRFVVGYRLTAGPLSVDEREDLIRQCGDRLTEYIAKRGDAIWKHRTLADRYVSGVDQVRGPEARPLPLRAVRGP